MDQALDSWLGKNNYDVYCISLKRSLKRRHKFTEWAKHVELSFEFWDATDYRDLVEEDFQNVCDVYIGKRRVSGASACRISITKCMQHFIENTNKPYLFILEDDAGFVNEGTKSGSSSSNLSNKQSLIDFINQCRQFTGSHKFQWEQIWFGYYDDDVMNYKVIDEKFPLVCLSLGTSMTHSMMISRLAVHELLSQFHEPQWKHLPIDEFTKTFMRSRLTTLIPPKSIICQTDDERCINYDG
jgi:hypothetical protein